MSDGTDSYILWPKYVRFSNPWSTHFFGIETSKFCFKLNLFYRLIEKISEKIGKVLIIYFN